MEACSLLPYSLPCRGYLSSVRTNTKRLRVENKHRIGAKHFVMYFYKTGSVKCARLVPGAHSINICYILKKALYLRLVTIFIIFVIKHVSVYLVYCHPVLKCVFVW